MIKSNSITVIAPNAKAQAMWVTMWAALLNVLYSLGFKVEAFEQPAKPVKAVKAVKATPKAKRAPVKRAARKPAAAKVEPAPAFIEIPFSRETYIRRAALKNLGAVSNRAAKLWVIPAKNEALARELLALRKPRAVPAAPVAVKVQAPVTPAPAYIGRPRAEFSSWLANHGYQAPTVQRPAVQAEPAPVASIAPPKAVKIPTPRKVTRDPKFDGRSVDERLAVVSVMAEPPSRRQIGRHLVWLREIRLEDLKAAVQAMKQTTVDGRPNLMFVAGDSTEIGVPVRALKRIVRLSAKWKAYGLYMNSTLGLMVRYDTKFGNSGHLIIGTHDRTRATDRDYVIALPNDRESTKAA